MELKRKPILCSTDLMISVSICSVFDHYRPVYRSNRDIKLNATHSHISWWRNQRQYRWREATRNKTRQKTPVTTRASRVMKFFNFIAVALLLRAQARRILGHTYFIDHNNRYHEQRKFTSLSTQTAQNLQGMSRGRSWNVETSLACS